MAVLHSQQQLIVDTPEGDKTLAYQLWQPVAPEAKRLVVCVHGLTVIAAILIFSPGNWPWTRWWCALISPDVVTVTGSAMAAIMVIRYTCN